MKVAIVLAVLLLTARSAFSEVIFTTVHPSWTALNTAGVGTAYVDIKLKPGTLPANASFAVEASSDSPRFTVSTARLTLGRTGTARLAIRSTGATNVLVRLRELTSGGQTLEASVNFYGALTLAVSTNSITLDDTLRINVYGAVPPCTITASPSDLLDIRPDGTAVARGARSGVVMLMVTDARKRKSTGSYVHVRVPFQPSLDAASWKLKYGVGHPPTPTRLTNAPGWFFNFPKLPNGKIGYVTQDAGGSYLRGSALQMTFTVEADPGVFFDHRTAPNNTSDFPAHVRFYLQRGSFSNEANSRWWSNPLAVKIAPGTAVLRVPLAPSEWSNLWSARGDADAATTAGFHGVLENLSEVGFTMGGGFFFGHGVRVGGGNARFVLTGMEVVP